MKTDDLLDALGEADPPTYRKLEDVRYLGARRKHFMQMAACVALLLIGGSYGMWQQYENATHTDVAKTESAETADTYEAAASDGDMTSDAAAPDGTAESAEEYEAAAQSTAGDGNGIQEAAQPGERCRELTGILTKWRNFRHRLPAGRKRRRRFHSQRNSFRTITESR